MQTKRRSKRGGLPPIHYAVLKGKKLAHLALHSKNLLQLATKKGSRGITMKKKPHLLADDIAVLGSKVHKKRKTRKSKIVDDLERIKSTILLGNE
jgi:hypothetical protein